MLQPLPAAVLCLDSRMLLPVLLEPVPSLPPAPALPLAREQKHWQYQYKLPTNRKRIKHEETLIFLQVTSWPACQTFLVLQNMFLADQNNQSLDFLLEAEAFATALLVPSLLELQHTLTDHENSTQEMKHASVLVSLQAQHRTEHICCKAPDISSVLFSPPALDALCLLPLYYQAEFLKEKGHSHRKGTNSYIYLLSAFHQTQKEEHSLPQMNAILKVNPNEKITTNILTTK